MEDIFAIQDEVTLAIMDRLKGKLLGEEKAELTKRHTENLEAYNLYLEGRHLLREMTKESLQKGIECLQKAIEIDPNYAMAYIGVASYYNNLGFYHFLPPKLSFPKAKEAAEKALQIDDSLAEAHTALGFFKMLYEWDWEGAEREYKRAIELNPSYATGHNLYAHYLMIMGRPEEATAENIHAQELNPLSRNVALMRANIIWGARQYDQSIVELKKLLEVNPTFYVGHYWLAFPYALKGMLDEAIAAVEKAMAMSGGGAPLMWMAFGMIHSFAGKREEAEKALQKMMEQSKQTYVAPWMMAVVHAGLGEKDKAFELLEESYKMRDHWLTYLKASPVVDNLRSDPRFKVLLKKMGFNK